MEKPVPACDEGSCENRGCSMASRHGAGSVPQAASRSSLKIAQAAAMVVLLASEAGALNLRVTPADMQRALTLARWPTTDRDRVQFHERYTFTVNSPTVDYFAVRTVEVVTECYESRDAEVPAESRKADAQ